MFGTKIKYFIYIAIYFISFPAIAQQQSTPNNAGGQSYMLPDLPYTYNEEFCDFTLKLPKEPNKKIIPNTIGEKSYKGTSLTFTEFFGITNAISLSGQCKEVSQEIRRSISEETLDEELDSIQKRHNLKVVSRDNRLIPNQRLRVATMVGQRRSDQYQGLYTYQIWLSDNSIFLLELEATGPEHPETDKLFVSILQSFQKKEAPAEENL